jgi:hypothetical protein
MNRDSLVMARGGTENLRAHLKMYIGTYHWSTKIGVDFSWLVIKAP